MLPADLPPGRLQLPSRWPGDQPAPEVMWLSDEPVSDPAAAWSRCLEQQEVTGWRPVLYGWPDPPESSFLVSPADIDAVALEAELTAQWSADRARKAEWDAMPPTPPDPDEPEWFRDQPPDPGPPFERWPGLAAAIDAAAGPDPDLAARDGLDLLLTQPVFVPAHVNAFFAGCHLALVSAARNADIPGVMGWACETLHARLCALLRSWDDRFGARVIAFQGAALYLSVARPPRTFEHAQHIALEHMLSTADFGESRFDEYADWLVDAPLWALWWD